MITALPLLPPAASSMAGHVDGLYLFLVLVTSSISLAVAVTLVGFALRYRRRPDRLVGEAPAEGATQRRIEVLWTAALVPLAVLLFLWGARVYYRLYTPPADAMVIDVVAKQWMWKFQHSGGQREINELHVPAGRDVRLVLATEDVIHSFYVPAFRLKMDVVPGRYRSVWFRATQPGRYRLLCAEFCGTSHAAMGGWIVVLPAAEYGRWLDGGHVTGSAASKGEVLFQVLGCHGCHRLDAPGLAPNLRGLYGRPVLLRDGASVIADEDYLRESILRPAARIAAGYQDVMPPYAGQINEEQLLQLITYLRALGAPPAAVQRGAGEATAATLRESL